MKDGRRGVRSNDRGTRGSGRQERDGKGALTVGSMDLISLLKRAQPAVVKTMSLNSKEKSWNAQHVHEPAQWSPDATIFWDSTWPRKEELTSSEPSVDPGIEL